MSPEEYVRKYELLKAAQAEREIQQAAFRLNAKLADMGICPRCETKTLTEISYHDLSGMSTYKCSMCKQKVDGEDYL